MKFFFGAWKLEEVRSFHAPVQNTASCNRTVDFGVKKYVIF
jgi:hypothetical protein